MAEIESCRNYVWRHTDGNIDYGFHTAILVFSQALCLKLHGKVLFDNPIVMCMDAQTGKPSIKIEGLTFVDFDPTDANFYRLDDYEIWVMNIAIAIYGKAPMKALKATDAYQTIKSNFASDEVDALVVSPAELLVEGVLAPLTGNVSAPSTEPSKMPIPTLQWEQASPKYAGAPTDLTVRQPSMIPVEDRRLVWVNADQFDDIMRFLGSGLAKSIYVEE